MPLEIHLDHVYCFSTFIGVHNTHASASSGRHVCLETIWRLQNSGRRGILLSHARSHKFLTQSQLRKAHPSEIVPPPPPKDRTYVNVNLSAPPSASTSPPSPFGASTHPSASFQHSVPSSPSMNYIPRQSRPMPGMYQNEAYSSVDSLQSIGSNSSSPGSPAIANGSSVLSHQASRLAREKNRLTLRAYLHSLLSSPVFASSPVLRSFLLSNPTRLRYVHVLIFVTFGLSVYLFSDEELTDARRREEADRMRDDGRIRFAKEIRERVDGLREAVRSVKGELMGKGTSSPHRVWTSQQKLTHLQMGSPTYLRRSSIRQTSGICLRTIKLS